MATATKTEKYTQAVGRRKTSTAVVRIYKGTKNSYTVNGKEFHVYFPTETLRSIANAPLTKFENPVKFKVSAKISGGGVASQAGAMRHALSRALIIFDTNLRGTMKKAGFLKRDPRAKERRKFGLKKARKAPQWSKR
ncbi:MAG: 30S ribosomal protein S9 [Candidatus Taylorbacteria bacterium RIFCSPHIGHO2_02_FULL_46_13]|uniref:30S ribosomal protein S9 n=1 Tax=Candidatus Taylorbacteria bacterium RIFCSPHIGHO2_02_FULL_46_13 TaxID=1802312 RepID=A0A1G2MTF1_9BACT|nr:MAG: 30S ribosomal protein S9 [Candidatus Taylorbacteria bacterium RIFCSPHIGHO2_02_FULL_46_13]